jgi:DNA-binding XRE family transcriptional regulator
MRGIKIDCKKMKLLRMENDEKERGWTQREVALKAGVSGQTYRQWEWGVSYPNKKNYKKLVKIFGEELRVEEDNKQK